MAQISFQPFCSSSIAYPWGMLTVPVTGYHHLHQRSSTNLVITSTHPALFMLNRDTYATFNNAYKIILNLI